MAKMVFLWYGILKEENRMRKSIFQKMSAVFLSMTLVVGMAASVPAAVKKGTDISASKAWQSFSVQTGEDKNEWKNALIKDGQKYDNKENVFKSYTENASMKTKTPKSFLMDIVSTGSSAQWGPSKKVDDLGNIVWEAKMSNPWGVTATKIVNIEKGRTYTISFKIKSTLKNEIKKTQNVPGKYYYETKDKKGKTIVHYTTSVVKKNGKTVDKATGNPVSHVGTVVGTGVMNYVKHIHFKAYRNNEKDGDPALTLQNVKATYNGKSVYSKKGDYTFIALDSRNKDYVTVTANVTIPGDSLAYKQSTMGLKFAFGSFTMEYPNENDMSGTIDVQDFKVVAGSDVPKATKVSKATAKAKKGTMKVSLKKAKGAKGYEVQYFTSYSKSSKSYSGKKTIKAKKNVVTIKNKKKFKAKKTIYVRARYYKTVNGKKAYSVWSAIKKVKVK